MILLSLVDQVIISILTEWLEMEDLTCLDSAFCNKLDRSFVHHMMSEFSFVQSGRVLACKPAYFNWIAWRNIRVNSLNLSGYNEKKLNNTMMQILSTITQLDYLEIKYCYNLEFIVEKYVKKIKHINLCNSYQLTDDNLSTLLNSVTGLTCLDISGCEKITDKAAKIIANKFPLLEMISVEHCPLVTSAFIEIIARGCPRLTKLIPTTDLTDGALIVVAKHCPQLEYLVLVGCSLISDVSIEAVARGCPSLKNLIAKGCNISDRSLSQIAMHCPLLADLFVQECDEVTDVSLLKIAECCPLLDCLVLAGCERITDTSVSHIAKMCPNLRDIHLSKCSLLTDECVLAIARYSRRLVMLDVVQCDLITDKGLSAVIEQCGNLSHLDIFDTQMSCEPLLLLAQDLQHLCVNGRVSFEELNKVNITWLPAGRTQLRSLSYNHPQTEVSEELLLAMAAASPGLQKLEVTSHSTLSDGTVTDLIAFCPLLNHVIFADCPELTSSAAVSVAQLCPLLTALELSDCPLSALGDEGLTQCVKHCGGQLKRLSVANCEGISDESIVCVARSCPLLEYLDLSYNIELTGVAIKAVAMVCPLLKELNLVGCEGLNISSLLSIVQGCANLAVLKLDDSFGQISMRGGRELIQIVAAKQTAMREMAFDDVTFVI